MKTKLLILIVLLHSSLSAQTTIGGNTGGIFGGGETLPEISDSEKKPTDQAQRLKDHLSQEIGDLSFTFALKAKKLDLKRAQKACYEQIAHRLANHLLHHKGISLDKSSLSYNSLNLGINCPVNLSFVENQNDHFIYRCALPSTQFLKCLEGLDVNYYINDSQRNQTKPNDRKQIDKSRVKESIQEG